MNALGTRLSASRWINPEKYRFASSTWMPSVWLNSPVVGSLSGKHGSEVTRLLVCLLGEKLRDSGKLPRAITIEALLKAIERINVGY